jgi:hypothetical protein
MSECEKFLMYLLIPVNIVGAVVMWLDGYPLMSTWGIANAVLWIVFFITNRRKNDD